MRLIAYWKGHSSGPQEKGPLRLFGPCQHFKPHPAKMLSNAVHANMACWHGVAIVALVGNSRRWPFHTSIGGFTCQVMCLMKCIAQHLFCQNPLAGTYPGFCQIQSKEPTQRAQGGQVPCPGGPRSCKASRGDMPLGWARTHSSAADPCNKEGCKPNCRS